MKSAYPLSFSRILAVHKGGQARLPNRTLLWGAAAQMKLLPVACLSHLARASSGEVTEVMSSGWWTWCESRGENHDKQHRQRHRSDPVFMRGCPAACSHGNIGEEASPLGRSRVWVSAALTLILDKQGGKCANILQTISCSRFKTLKDFKIQYINKSRTELDLWWFEFLQNFIIFSFILFTFYIQTLANDSSLVH